MDAFGLDKAPKSLRSRLRRKALPAGTMLFRRGDPAMAVFVIEQGRIAMVRHTPEGRRVTLFSAGPGESFAEAALFSDTYHCDAVAEVASRVVIVPKAEFRLVLAQQRIVAERVMVRLAHQVQELRQKLELRNIRAARERVWQALLLAAGPTTRHVIFDRPLKDVAPDMGLTHEAFYRALASLARSGRIRRRGRRIDIIAI